MNDNAHKTPIYIGITGHRDLPAEDVEGHIRTVTEIIEEIKALAPHSDVKVLTPLAKGADRVAAYAAQKAGVPYVAILPFSKKLYEKDFDIKEDLKEFRDLLKNAEASLTLELYKDHTQNEIQKYGEKRNLEYAKVGAYVSDHSLVLVALWNGWEPPQGQKPEVGGTEQVVHYRIEGVMEGFNKRQKYLATPDYSNVFHVFARRSQKQIEVTTPPDDLKERFGVELTADGRYHILSPLVRAKENRHGNSHTAYQNQAQTRDYQWGQTFTRQIIKKHDRFNKDKSRLLKEIEITELTESLCAVENKNFEESRLHQNFAFADALANKLYQKNRRFFLALLGFGAGAFIALTIFNSWLPYPAFFLLTPLLFAIAFFIHRHVKKTNLEDRYYEYRTIAEALRVQYYWDYFQIKEPVEDFYPSKYHDDMCWILLYLRGIRLASNLHSKKRTKRKTGTALKICNTIREKWLINQEKYFKNKLQKHQKTNQTSNIISRYIIGAIALAWFAMFAGSLYCSGGFFAKGDIYLNSPFHKWFMVLIDSLIAFAGIRTARIEWEAVEAEMKQFYRMNRLYERAIRRLEESVESGKTAEIEAVVKELGIEALCETADWLQIQRLSSMALKR